MSPELRYAAQLNRLARALEKASVRGWELDPDNRPRQALLDRAAEEVRFEGRMIVEGVAKRGSEFSPPNGLVT